MAIKEQIKSIARLKRIYSAKTRIQDARAALTLDYQIAHALASRHKKARRKIPFLLCDTVSRPSSLIILTAFMKTQEEEMKSLPTSNGGFV